MEELGGVMALPEAQGPMGMAPDQEAIFKQIRQNIPRPEITQELLAAGEEADPQAVAEFKQELAGLNLSPEELNRLNTMVDAILAAPQDYASLRRAYLAEGIPEDLLPEQFDPAFFTALNMALDTIAMNPASPPPMAMAMAMGGVASLAAYGRNGDTMLAHITPQEAAMLKRMGGSGTINPYTGLPEFFLGKIFKKIGNAVKKFAKSTVGKIIIGAGLAIFGGPIAASFLSGLAGGSATVLGGFLSSTAGNALVGGFLSGAGTTLAAGGNLKQALKAGAVGGLSGVALAGLTGGSAAFEARPLYTPPPPPTNVDTLASSVSVQQPPPLIDSSSVQVGDVNMTPRITTTGTASGTPYQPTLRQGDFPFSKDLIIDEMTLPDLRNPAPPPAVPGAGATSSAVPGAAAPPPVPSGGGGGTGQSSFLDRLETAYDRFMPEALGGKRGAVDPRVVATKQADAIANVTAAHPSLAVASVKDSASKNVFDQLVAREATKLATPSLLSTYGPLAATGLGVMALGGGFNPEQPQKPDEFNQPTGYQRYFSFPDLYRLQFGGIRPTSYGETYAATGGIMSTPQAMRIGNKTYPRKTGSINGPGTGTSDSIPAMLSDGEFVFTAKSVRAMGNGSRRKGAKKMYKLMKMLEGKAA